MAGVIAAVAVAATTINVVQQRKAAKENKEANDRARRIEAVRAQNERAKAIREQRRAAASVIQAGAAGGTLSGSGTQGALAGYATDSAANLSMTNQLDALNAQRMDHLEAASRAQNIGQLAQSAGSGIVSLYGIKK